ncbi:MAG TPA: sugar phosphate isomerase/epimerase family protein [bacterium]
MNYSCLPMIYFKAIVLDQTLSLVDWLEIAAGLPLDGTEIHWRMLPTAPGDLDRLRAALNARRLRVSQVTCAPDFTHPDATMRTAEIARTRNDIEVAAALGATCVRITAGQAHPQTTRVDGIRWVVDAVRPLLDHAARHQVFLAFENHYKDYFWDHPDFAQRAETFLEIVHTLGPHGLRVNYDTSNQVMIGEDPLAVLAEIQDLVVHVHCSDRVGPGTYLHAPAGEGIVDFPAIFRLLQTSGYDGWLSAEYNGPEGLDGLTRALGYIRATWGRVASLRPAPGTRRR